MHNYHDEVHNIKAENLKQTTQPGRNSCCEHCKQWLGHELTCPEVTLESIGFLLKQARSQQQSAKESAARYLEQAQAWAGKNAILRHENNKLRAANNKLKAELKSSIKEGS